MESVQEKIIIVENLTKQFGDFTAVKGISFHVNNGEIFGFLGANGAGKTTAMKMLIGISNPTNVQPMSQVLMCIHKAKRSNEISVT